VVLGSFSDASSAYELLGYINLAGQRWASAGQWSRDFDKIAVNFLLSLM
jgi:hypothetical protein